MFVLNALFVTKLILITSKSFGVLFHTLFIKSFEPVLQLDGILIKFVNSVKDLGVYLSNNLPDHQDMMRQIKYLYAYGKKFRSIFSRSSERIKNILFKEHCFSFYACQLWVRYKFESFR